jgi:hypothetical protein
LLEEMEDAFGQHQDVNPLHVASDVTPTAPLPKRRRVSDDSREKAKQERREERRQERERREMERQEDRQRRQQFYTGMLDIFNKILDKMK